MTKARQKVVRKVNEMKSKTCEISGDHQGYIEWMEKFDFGNLPVEDRKTTKNERWTMKNGGKPSRNRPQKCLGSVTKALQLGFSSRKQFFSLIISDSQIAGGFNIFVLPSFPYLYGTRGRWLPPSSPRWARLLPPEGTAFWRNILEGPSRFGCYLHPLFY